MELDYPEKIDPDVLLNNTPSPGLIVKGETTALDFGGWQNLLVEGDNLYVLRSLLDDNNIRGNVRLVYIDPPFATEQIFRVGNGRVSTISRSNNGAIAYNDELNGHEYLEYIRRRLILIRELLADDGSIYVHIDYKIGHYLKAIMDEVFGSGNFINDITRVKCNPKNFERKAFGNIKDMILFYSKGKEYVWNEPRTEFSEEDIIRLFPKVDDDGRRYTTTPLHAPGETQNGPTGQSWRGMKPPEGRHWRYPPTELEKLDETGLIEWSRTGNPRKIVYADEQAARGKRIQDIWEFKDPVYPEYPTEKNLDMLRLIIETSSNPQDLVLDAFAGSGTTLVAAEMLGRRWIGIDNSPVAIEVTRKRLSDLNSAVKFLEVVEEGAIYERME